MSAILTGDEQARRRAARRAAIKAHHPDRGGGPGELAAALAQWDAVAPIGVVTTFRGRLGRLLRGVSSGRHRRIRRTLH
jgi:hypothetical protein